MKKPEIVYYYRGLIERVTVRGRGSWIPGYSVNGSNGGITYPWKGKRACQAEARDKGCRAVFVEKRVLTTSQVSV